MLRKCWKKVSMFDRFKRPIIFYFEQSTNRSTQLGTIISLMVYIAVLYLFFTSDMIFKRHPIITDQTLEALSRPEILIKSAIAVGIENDDAVSFLDSSIFKVEVKETYYKTNEGKKNGKDIIYDTLKGTRECRDEDFDPGEFDRIGFYNKTCTENKTTSLRGYWDELELSVLTITLSRCDNESSEVVCKSDDEIDEYLLGKFFSVYLKNPQYDLTERENFEKITMRNDFQTIDPNILKRWNVFMKKVIFIDDQNWLLENPTLIESYSYDLRETDMILETRTKNLFIADIYSSQKVQRKSRTYKKIQGVLADTGGIASVLLIIGYLLTYPEFNLNATMAIMSSLFDFTKTSIKGAERYPEQAEKRKYDETLCEVPQSCQNIASERKDNDKNIAMDISARKIIAPMRALLGVLNKIPECRSTKIIGEVQCRQLDNNNQEMKQSCQNQKKKEEYKVRVENEDEYIEEYNKNKLGVISSPNNIPFQFNIWEYLRFIFKKHFRLRLNEKEQLFFLVESNYKSLLNVSSILQRLHALELKTNLLFKPYQNKMISEAPKPIIFNSARISRLKLNSEKKRQLSGKYSLDKRGPELTLSTIDFRRKIEDQLENF